MRNAIIANREIDFAGMKEHLSSNERVDTASQSHTLYRAKNLVLRQEDKSYALDFQKLRSWCQLWEERGCGSYIMDTDKDHCFVSITIVSDAALRRCKLVGQKVLAVDGIYMKHRVYHGYMMAVEAQDGNGESFLLAVKICPNDSQKQYTGLFDAIKAHDVDGEPFGSWLDCPGKFLISQCSEAIIGALKESLPQIGVLKCCRKLLEEAKELGSFQENDFWEIQGTTSAAKFHKLLRQMSVNRPKQAIFFNGTYHKLWAKYKWLEQNMQTGNRTTACFFSGGNPPPSLQTACTLPPIGALAQVADLMCAQTLDSKDAVKHMMEARSIITDFARQELSNETEESRSCTVEKVSNHEGSAKQHDIPNNANDRVNFSSKTCTCGEWQLHGRPCHHAIKFAPVCFGQAEMNDDPYLWLRFGWDPIYLVETYSLAVETGRDMTAPQRSQLSDDGTTRPPKHFTVPPRLRKRQRTDNSASTATKETGETNETTATTTTTTTTTTAATTTRSTTISKRTGRLLIAHHCANCGVAGHKAHKCPAPIKYEEAETSAEDWSTGIVAEALAIALEKSAHSTAV